MIMIKAQQAASVAASVSVAASSNVSSSSGTNRIAVGGTIIDLPATNVAQLAKPTTNTGGSQQASAYVGGTPIYIQIDGKTIATATQSQSLSGNPASVSRLAGMFAG